MKAKLVYESINFERRKHPMTAMGIGDQIAQYEKKMSYWLEQFDAQAAKYGFVDDMETHEKNWVQDTWETDGEIEHYIRSYVKPSTILNRKMPRVKLGLREIPDYDENDTVHYAPGPVFYIIYSDDNHVIDKPGESWSGFSTEGKLLNWASDYPWEKLLKKGKIHRFDKQLEREARRDARRDRRKLRSMKESVNFKRGLDPKRSMKIGEFAKRPHYDLFMDLHEYCKNDEFPGFERVTDIDWGHKGNGDRAEPSFNAYVTEPKEEAMENMYQFELTESAGGVTVFHDHYTTGGEWTSDDYEVDSMNYWERIVKSQHVQHFSAEDWHGDPGNPDALPESVSFERGLDPRAAVRIGTIGKRGVEIKDRWVHKGSKQLMRIEDIADALYLYGNHSNNDYLKVFRFPGVSNPNKFVVRTKEGEPADYDEGYKKISYSEILTLFLDLIDEDPEFRPFVSNRVISHEYKKWDPLLESVKFERGRDPKDAMGVGVMAGYRKMVSADSVQDHYKLFTNIIYFIQELNHWYAHLGLSKIKEEGYNITRDGKHISALEIFLEWVKLAEDPEFQKVLDAEMGPIVEYDDPTDFKEEDRLAPDLYLLPRKPTN